MHNFRKAKPEDANSITRLYQELTTNSQVDVLAERIADISEDPNTYLIVCEESGAILATALLTLCNDVMFKRQPFAIIENIVVSKEVQRSGIGRRLMHHIEAFCLQKIAQK